MSKLNNVLITGNKGFVGKNLTSYLRKKNFLVTGITRSPSSENEMDYETLSKKLLDNYSVFIHLAGKAHDLKNISDEKDYFTVNTELTKTLFNQFLQGDCSVFIYLSSVKAVADEVSGVLVEDVEPNPLTAYGKSKLAAETYIFEQSLPKGKKVYVLRPCMIHGPGNKGNLNLLYKFVSKGIPYPLGAYDNKRSFLSVENLCFIISKLIQQQPASGIYNVSDDEAISTVRLIKIIAKALNKKIRTYSVSKVIIQAFASVNSLFRLPFSTEKLQKLTESYVVDNQKIKKYLDIELPVSTEDGLIKTIKSFK